MPTRFRRGEYDKPDKSQKLEPGVPESLPQLPNDVPKNRLSLARWLVDSSNPLTARVTVNRFWQQYFGIGIVKTAEEFGSQGEWPSHPLLIDWLATEFIRSGWDVKGMQKLIVMSSAYRQSSNVTPGLYKQDPENRLLARGPRFRLDRGCSEWTFTATRPDGSNIEIDGCDLFTFEAGKIRVKNSFVKNRR